jgi:hypothetical protein
MGTKPFDDTKFIRDTVGITIEERDCEKRDLSAEDQAHYLDADFQQVYLDPYIMRRWVIDVDGHQDCDTISVLNAVIQDYLELDEVTPEDFLVAGGTGSTLPSGKYLLQKFHVNDRGDGFSVVSVAYRQYGEWTKIQIKEVTS